MKMRAISLLLFGGLFLSFHTVEAKEDPYGQMATLPSRFVERSLHEAKKLPAFKDSDLIQKVKPLTESYAAELVSILIAAGQPNGGMVSQPPKKQSGRFGGFFGWFAGSPAPSSQGIDVAGWLEKVQKCMDAASGPYAHAMQAVASGKDSAAAAGDFIKSFNRLHLDEAMQKKLTTKTEQHFKHLSRSLKGPGKVPARK